MEMKDGPLSPADEASINRQPKPTDPQEQRIVDVIKDDLLSTAWSRNLFEDQLRQLLINYFNDSLAHLDDDRHIHDRTQEVLRDFSGLSHARIVEGNEYLDELKGQNAFLLTNHLGTYKILGINPETELDHPEINLPVLHPFPAFYASLYPVAEALGDNLYESAHDYPGPIRRIQEAAGSLILPPGQTNTLPDIERETKEMFDGKKGMALTIFPEGGTSGKRNMGGPYSLERFRTGSLVIAGDLGIPVIPVAQYFNPNNGFELKVFPPMNLKPSEGTEESRNYFHQQASSIQGEMQQWLDQRSSA